MYNRYMSGQRSDEDFVPAAPPLSELEISLQPQNPFTKPAESTPEKEKTVAASSNKGLLGNLFGGRKGKSGGILDGLFGGLNNIDIGDIILLLIVILLILEEDDMDLIIVLGLVLLLGI
ncbi:MAG: hypothetical protein GX257_04855 [Clostridiales bacterium]|nr:hypothetical protein [Clostridiales bacterium]